MWEGIQLVPVRDGQVINVLDLGPLLLLSNTANQESSRIVWQRQRTGYGAYPNAAEAGSAIRFQTVQADAEFDVKVKRRFARDQWALVYSLEMPRVMLSETDFPFGIRNFRMLYAAADSL